MTISVKVHVNGRYRATVVQTVEGQNQTTTVIEGAYDGSPNPSGEGHIWFQHGKTNTFEITEEYLGEKQVVRDVT
jgi:hypothetical protein